MSNHLHECPHCGTSLVGTPIPTEHLDLYGASAICPDCGQPSHGSRVIGLYSYNVDRTVAWRCPDCTKEWARQ